MRRELRTLINHTELIDEYELNSTVELCHGVVQSHWRATHERFDLGDEENHEYNEALSDQNFRTASEIQCVWQLGLWRLIALFEGLMSQWFPDLATRGLTQKLNYLRTNYGIPTDLERRMLTEWLSLRNAFSHRPARAPSLDHQLIRKDLEELANLMRTVLDGLRPHAVGQVSGK